MTNTLASTLLYVKDTGKSTVSEFIDPVFTKTSPKRSFSLNRKRAFWLVFAKTGSIISGTGTDMTYVCISVVEEWNYSIEL